MTALRFLLSLATVGALSGCLLTRIGHAPTDPDRDRVHNAINAVARSSFERNVRGADWVPHRESFGVRGGMANGLCECEWFTQFTCRAAVAPPVEGRPLPTSEYVRILGPIRNDVLTAVTDTRVEVTWTSPVELTEGANPEARFEIRYLRKNREIAGEVIGRLRADGPERPAEARFSDLRIRFRERDCK
jgi:hypothetical protein